MDLAGWLRNLGLEKYEPAFVHAGAEQSYRQALAIAGQRGAKVFELRGATTLAPYGATRASPP